MPAIIRLHRLPFSLGSVVIAVIGYLTLPEDIATSSERIENVFNALTENVVSGAALLVGLALLLFINWDVISRRVLGRKRWSSDEALGDELHGWLRSQQYQLTQLGQQDINPELMHVEGSVLVFGFLANDPLAKRGVIIFKLVGMPGVIIQCMIKPANEAIGGHNHHQIIANMTVDQREAMREDLGIELARVGLGFYFDNILETGIVISHGFIPSDNLTQFQFLEQIGRVARATLLVQLIVTKHVRLADTSVPAVAISSAVPELPAAQGAES